MALDRVRLATLFATAVAIQAQAASPSDVYGRWTPYDEKTRVCVPDAEYRVTVTRSELRIDYAADIFFPRPPGPPRCTARQCKVPTGWPEPAATWTWTFRAKDVALIEGWIRDVDWPQVADFQFKHTLKRGC